MYQVFQEEQYGGNIDWTQILTKLKKIKVTNKVKEFQLKKGQSKRDIEKFEKQLEDLKSSTDDGDIIKAAKIHSRIKWAEERERSTRYFFEFEKKNREKIKCGIELKTQKVSINMI
jgi:hypothetical protein